MFRYLVFLWLFGDADLARFWFRREAGRPGGIGARAYRACARAWSGSSQVAENGKPRERLENLADIGIQP